MTEALQNIPVQLLFRIANPIKKVAKTSMNDNNQSGLMIASEYIYIKVQLNGMDY